MTTCPKCNGTGWYPYDDNHSKVCEACCHHDQGWWELSEHYAGYRPGKVTLACKRGCGSRLFAESAEIVPDDTKLYGYGFRNFNIRCGHDRD